MDAGALDTAEIEDRAVKYMGIREDGSGWAAVEDRNEDGGGRRQRHDSDLGGRAAAVGARRLRWMTTLRTKDDELDTIAIVKKMSWAREHLPLSFNTTRMAT